MGGLHSLSVYNTNWYFEKEINIAISGGSRVCVSVHERVLHTSKKTERRISTSNEDIFLFRLEL